MRNRRSSMPSRRVLVLVISVNPLRLRTDPSAFRWRLSTFVPGLLKCGVLVAFSASARISSSHRSDTRTSRKSPMSRLTAPGPRSRLKPAVPKRAVVTGAKASGSNQDWPGPVLPKYCTLDLIRSARWEPHPGQFRGVVLELTLNGEPVNIASSAFSLQPPASAEPAPPFSHFLPLPKGRSAVPLMLKLCVRSNGITARVSLRYSQSAIAGPPSPLVSQQTPIALDQVYAA